MTAILGSPDAPRPLVRIRRAPALEPPADDDRRADDHPVCAGQLALFTSVHGVRVRAGHPTTAHPTTAHPTTPSDRRAGARCATATAANHTAATSHSAASHSAASHSAASHSAGLRGPIAPAADPTSPRAAAAGTGTPPARATAQVAASRFVAACVEVLNGFRPVAHLRALTTPVEFDTITTQLTRRTARVRMPGRGSAGQKRVSLRRLRTFEQRAGVAEAVAVLHHGETSWAMALRFEHRRGSWLCTLLEVI